MDTGPRFEGYVLVLRLMQGLSMKHSGFARPSTDGLESSIKVREWDLGLIVKSIPALPTEQVEQIV